MLESRFPIRVIEPPVRCLSRVRVVDRSLYKPLTPSGSKLPGFFANNSLVSLKGCYCQGARPTYAQAWSGVDVFILIDLASFVLARQPLYNIRAFCSRPEPPITVRQNLCWSPAPECWGGRLADSAKPGAPARGGPRQTHFFPLVPGHGECWNRSAGGAPASMSRKLSLNPVCVQYPVYPLRGGVR